VRRGSVVVVLLLLAAAMLPAATTKRKAAKKHVTPAVTHRVVMEAMQFHPATLTVKRGDTIVWINKDLVPHTASASKKGAFDSSVIAAGASWKHTIGSKGDFAYNCAFHPTMKGVIQVK
jgi:plastocyanin